MGIGGAREWPQAIAEDNAFVSALPAQVQMSLGLFARNVKWLPYRPLPQPGIPEVFARLENYRPSGSTSVYDAILAGLSHPPGLQPGDAIVVASDGDDDSSHAGADAVREQLLMAGVRLFFLGPAFPGSIARARQLARDSGGDYIEASKSEDAAASVAAMLSQQWILTVTVPAGKKGKLELTPGPDQHNLSLLYPRVKIACGG